MVSNATILTAFINSRNATRGAFLTVSDASHWAEYGIYTIAQYLRFCQEQFVWDAYKDVHGFSPRGLGIADMTDAELDEMADYLSRRMEEEAKRQRDQWEIDEQDEKAHALYLAQIDAERNGMTLVSVNGELTAVRTSEDIAEDWYAANGL
jgi:hypothetical protein